MKKIGGKKKKKMKNKIGLFSVLAVFALVAVIAIPSVSAANPAKVAVIASPSVSAATPANSVYFEPEDSSAQFCENTYVEILVNASVDTTGAGMDIYFDPDCVNITNVDFTGTPYSMLTGWTHGGDYVRIGVMGPMAPIQPGIHLIANLTLHCEKEAAECTSDLLFKETELLDYNGDPLLDVTWHDGTFTCEVDKPDLNVTEITLNCGYLFASESNEICAKIENIGGGAAGAFNVNFDIDGFSTEVR
ncbi:CARDB protein, partial [Methanophagales archaeon]